MSEKLNQENNNELKILPDSSWLIALLDEKDSHNTAAKSSLGALLPYNPDFYVPVIVFMEVMSKLVRVNKISVAKCEKKITKLLGDILHARHNQKLELSNILGRYKLYSRLSFKSLTSTDFYIVTEGIGIGAKILTCDIRMYNAAKKYYQEIYFLTDQTSKNKSDLGRLISDIQKN